MSQLSLLVLRCADLPASVAFYRALGLDFRAEQHGNSPEHFACENQGLVFELYPSTKPGDTQSRLGFRVASLETALQNLQELGIEAAPKNSPWGVRAVVRDPDGRAVEISGLPIE